MCFLFFPDFLSGRLPGRPGFGHESARCSSGGSALTRCDILGGDSPVLLLDVHGAPWNPFGLTGPQKIIGNHRNKNRRRFDFLGHFDGKDV